MKFLIPAIIYAGAVGIIGAYYKVTISAQPKIQTKAIAKKQAPAEKKLT